jgi:hypothetical protein
MTAADLIRTANRLALEVAVHEAGHAVIARAVGWRGGKVTLQDADGNARNYYHVDDDRTSLKEALVGLGGRAATEVLLGHASDPGCAIDDAKIGQVLEANGFGDKGFAFDVRMALLADVHALIRRHQAAVALVAVNLLARETLSGAEIDQLVGGLECS